MEFEYAYRGNTAVEHRGDRTELSFSPDTKRPPTYFSGELRQNVAFREAISALHDVVVSDLRFKPKDKTAYKAWAAKQEDADLDAIVAQRQRWPAALEDRCASELAELERQQRSRACGPFYRGPAALLRLPLREEQGRLVRARPGHHGPPGRGLLRVLLRRTSPATAGSRASYEVFQNVGEFACGTTNIDYSSRAV